MLIGIVTFTNGTNYGQRLQNYAVQEVIKKFGHNPETLYNAIENNSSIKKMIKGFLKYLINYKGFRIQFKRELAFTRFNKRNISFSKYNLTNLNKLDSISNYYDCFVCGSDQIWNPYSTKYVNENNFLQFTNKRKRISFAPSFAVNSIPAEKVQQYACWLEGFDHLSVREKAGAQIIKELTGKDAVVLVDPTLLLSKNDWLKISSKPICKPIKKYILMYFLGHQEEEYISRIRNIAQKNNMEIFDLLDTKDVNKYSIDPSEFIDLVKDASLVCTDSFHGTVFSIIMEVPFIIFQRNGKEVSMNSRIETLLSLFNLECRLEKNVISNEQIFNVNYEHVDSILKVEKAKSMQYLKNVMIKK